MNPEPPQCPDCLRPMKLQDDRDQTVEGVGIVRTYDWACECGWTMLTNELMRGESIASSGGHSGGN